MFDILPFNWKAKRMDTAGFLRGVQVWRELTGQRPGLQQIQPTKAVESQLLNARWRTDKFMLFTEFSTYRRSLLIGFWPEADGVDGLK